MAISPPSDLVLDVAMAADPDTLRASVEKLRTMVSDRVAAQMQLSRDNFASMQQTAIAGDGASPEVPMRRILHTKSSKLLCCNPLSSPCSQETIRQSSVEGIAGDYWKSMMAEAVANKMADAGGIGIARMLEQQSAKKANNEATSPRR